MKIAKLTPSILAGISLGIYLSGCMAVQPWERGTLAKPQMALEPYPEQSIYLKHINGSREAATGSSSAEGGGCGCY
jgi:hypothetical protein